MKQINGLVKILGKLGLLAVGQFVLVMMILFSFVMFTKLLFIFAACACLIVSILFSWEILSLIDLAIRWKK